MHYRHFWQVGKAMQHSSLKCLKQALKRLTCNAGAWNQFHLMAHFFFLLQCNLMWTQGNFGLKLHNSPNCLARILGYIENRYCFNKWSVSVVFRFKPNYKEHFSFDKRFQFEFLEISSYKLKEQHFLDKLATYAEIWGNFFPRITIKWFHLSFLPEYSVKWFAFQKFNNSYFRIFWKLSKKFLYPLSIFRKIWNFWFNWECPR